MAGNEDQELFAPVMSEVTVAGVRVQASFSPLDATLSWIGGGVPAGSGGNAGGGSIRLDDDLLGYEVEEDGAVIELRTFSSRPVGGLCASGRQQRRRDVIRMEFGGEGWREDLLRWKTKLEAWRGKAGRPRRLLVLVNPRGGQGKAAAVFEKQVAPLLSAANIQSTVQMTEYLRHAADVARGVDLSSFDGILCVSGDGVLMEVLNGLLQRPDWRQAVEMPVGVVPAGSGNGMAASLCYLGREEYNVQNATFLIIKGHVRPLDVATVSQGPLTVHSFLNVNWALVSDVDIESEKYRWMGGFRLTFQSIVRIISLRRYTGRISYLPADEAPAVQGSDETLTELPEGGFGGPQVTPAEQRGKWRVLDGEFILLWAQNTPWASYDMHCTPQAELSDGCLDVLVVQRSTPLALLSLFLSMSEGKHLTSPLVQYLKVRAMRLEVGGRTTGGKKGGIVAVDGEVVARGLGAAGDPKNDPMRYDEPFEVGVTQGLARVFGPQ